MTADGVSGLPVPTDNADPVDYAALFHEAPAGYLLTRPDGTIVEANRTLCGWTGKTRAVLLGTSVYRLMPAGDRIMYLTHAMPELDATGVLTELSVQILGADGARMPVLLAASRSRTAEGAPELDRIILSPASERRLYERELASALRKLEAAEADRARLLDQARYEALHDILTGLPNRALLADRLDSALTTAARGGGQVGLLFCDVNGFKAVNDTMGHAAGDQVLCHVADRLSDAVRGVDTLARYSGDEFVVLVAGPAGMDDLETVAARTRMPWRFRPRSTAWTSTWAWPSARPSALSASAAQPPAPARPPMPSWPTTCSVARTRTCMPRSCAGRAPGGRRRQRSCRSGAVAR